MADVAVTITDLSDNASGTGSLGTVNVDTGVGATGPEGDPGADGREVSIRVSGGFIQWQYVGDVAWTNLIATASLAGPAGMNGTNGADGDDGREVELQVDTDMLQWRYVGDPTWTDLYDLSTLGGGGAVDSVNGQTGVVVLDASDVGAATSAQGALADTAVQPGDLGTAAAADTGDFDAAGAAASAQAAAIAASQPLDSDLTAIAALSTTSFGRALLTAADAAAARTAIGAGTSSFDGAYSSLSGKPTLGTAAAAATGDFDAAGAAAAAQAASQPLDSDLTAIAALTTTSYGRAFLALADAAAARTALSLGTAALISSTAGGDLSGTLPSPTVTKVNGTSLAGLGTGLLKNTTGTGVPSIAVAADIPNIAESQVTNLVTDLAAKAPLASPALTGNPTAPTPSAADNDTSIATTAFVKTAIDKQPEVFVFALGDETTAITTGTAKVTWRCPFAFTVTAVRASLTTASSSGIPTVDINEGGTTILSTKLTIDASELTSTTAATPAVISDASLADDAEITFDIDVAGTGAKGLKVTIYGTRT